MAATKMTPRRPIQSLRGSEIQPALFSQFHRRQRATERHNLQQGNGDVRHGIDEANDPAILSTVSLACDRPAGGASRVRDTQSDGERQIGAIGAGLSDVSVLCTSVAKVRSVAYLIPTLDGGSDRVEEDCVVEGPRVLPAMSDLLSEGELVGLVEVVDGLEADGVLGDQGTLAQQGQNVGRQALVAVELFDSLEESLAWNASEGVLDLTLEVLGEAHSATLALMVNGLLGGVATVTLSTASLRQRIARSGTYTASSLSSVTLRSWSDMAPTDHLKVFEKNSQLHRLNKENAERDGSIRGASPGGEKDGHWLK